MSAIKSNLPSAALILAGIALIVAMTGPATAGSGKKQVTRASVKSIATKQVKRLAPGLSVKKALSADQAKTAKRADLADTARRADIADLADRSSNVMAASVPIAPSCSFDSNTGGITAERVGNACDVTFPRSVEECAVGANPLHPMEDVGGEATIRKLGGPSVRVTRNDPLGNGPVSGLFAIYAICS